jgi:hypothetical protein
MTNYTKTTDFAAKDALPSGNSAKIVKGSEIDTEFNNIATASATKANANSAALTGTTTFETISDGTIAITAFVDEDNMASDSATLLPTQQSVKAYVDSQVTAQDLDVTDGSTSIDIDLDSESLGILGGTGIDSTASGTGVTLAIDSTVATLTGSQTLSNKTLSTPVVSGNLTTDGLLDGRDVATDGTKLDGIEASADVTDTANVTAAGALMDSELTSEASVKALNQGVATTDSPTFAGLTTTADVSFGDNDKAIFGAGSDLQIYHDGSNSHITEGGTGDLIIRGANIEIQTGGGNKYFQGASNAARLYHTNNEKLTTTAAGISVTGTATMDGLTVDGIASVSATNPKIQLFETDTTDLNTQIQNQAGDFIVSRLDDDAGSLTVHFSIDHSTGNVSIPSGDLDVTGTVTADGLTVDGGNTIRLNASSTNDFLTLTQNGTQAVITADSDATGSLVFQTTSAGSSADRLEIAAGGDISFYEDTGTTPKLFWDASAESLGIGTTSPSNYASGLVSYNTPITVVGNQYDGNLFNSVFFGGSAENLTYRNIIRNSLSATSANQKMQFSVANGASTHADVLTLTGSGNVGIGTTSPAFAAGAGLEIEKAGTATLRLQDTTNTANGEIRSGPSGIEFFSGAYGTSGDPFSFSVSGTTALTIDSSRNVGIGTSSPATLLDIKEGTTATDAIIGITAGTGGRAQIRSEAQADNTSSELSFHTMAGSSTNEAMRIDSSGNLLVGTTDAAVGVGNTNVGHSIGAAGYAAHSRSGNASLFLNRTSSDGEIARFSKDGSTVGSIGTDASRFKVKSHSLALYLENESNKQLVWGNVSGVPYFYPQSDNDTNIGYPTQRFKDLYLSGDVNLANNSQITFASTSCNIEGNSSGADFIKFTTGNNEAARIDSSQNLLVGGTTLGQDDSLGVAQNGKLTIAKASSSSAVMASFKNGGTSVGTIVTSTTATAYNTSSDQRLKENIADADDAGSKVDAIQVRKFDWIADGSHQDYGMIAQELQAVAPEAVSGDADSDEMMGVDYSKLVPMLVKEIQSLRARVAQLEN